METRIRISVSELGIVVVASLSPTLKREPNDVVSILEVWACARGGLVSTKYRRFSFSERTAEELGLGVLDVLETASALWLRDVFGTREAVMPTDPGVVVEPGTELNQYLYPAVLESPKLGAAIVKHSILKKLQPAVQGLLSAFGDLGSM